MQKTWVWSLVREDPTCHAANNLCPPSHPSAQGPRPGLETDPPGEGLTTAQLLGMPPGYLGFCRPLLHHGHSVPWNPTLGCCLPTSPREPQPHRWACTWLLGSLCWPRQSSRMLPAPLHPALDPVASTPASTIWLSFACSTNPGERWVGVPAIGCLQGWNLITWDPDLITWPWQACHACPKERNSNLERKKKTEGGRNEEGERMEKAFDKIYTQCW